VDRPVLSVVIPTRDRPAELALTLSGLAMQVDLTGHIEVIVVDDGSVDPVQEPANTRPCSGIGVQVHRRAASGPASARNHGIAIANAPRVLLLGDDTIPEPTALAAHIRVAGDRKVAVQGMISWDTAVGVTDVMRFMAPAGPQYWFRGLGEGDLVPWSSVVSANLSAPREWFENERFDELFTEACMEDTELAWRWRQRGWTVEFSPAAGCRHRHRYEGLGPLLLRQRRAGRWARTAIRLHPRLAWRLALQPLIVGLGLAARTGLVGRDRPRRREQLWDLRCRRAYLAGLLAPSR
jgi:GT2 family glycosyltransferase